MKDTSKSSAQLEARNERSCIMRKKKHEGKRGLSILLVLAIVATLLPFSTLTTYAAEDITAQFTDPNFLAGVRAITGKKTGPILDTDVSEITDLNVTYRNISSLAGIGNFTALYSLYCGSNQLTELDVSHNPELYYLDCRYNYIPNKIDVTGVTIDESEYLFTPQNTRGEKIDIARCTITLAPTSYTYDGKAKTPAVTVTDGRKTLVDGTDYTLTYTDNIEVGTANVIVTGKGDYQGLASKTFEIAVAETAAVEISKCTITLAQTSYTYDGKAKIPAVTVTNGRTALANNADYTLAYTNNVTVGTATVAITGKGNYTGSISKPFTIVKGNAGITYTKTYNKEYGAKPFTLDAKSTGGAKLAYTTSNAKIATVDSKGKVALKGTGIATITVKVDTPQYNAESVAITIKVAPKKQAAASAKPANGKKLTIKWKKDASATSYEIQYSTDRKFKKSVKTVDIKKNATTATTVKKLAKGSIYYVRLRAYKTAKVGGKTEKLYAAWSFPKKAAKIK
ncbi:fibronectin type III domain-containing protein [Lachnospiraceae bacterium ZAX-1]